MLSCLFYPALCLKQVVSINNFTILIHFSCLVRFSSRPGALPSMLMLIDMLLNSEIQSIGEEGLNTQHSHFIASRQNYLNIKLKCMCTILPEGYSENDKS